MKVKKRQKYFVEQQMKTKTSIAIQLTNLLFA
jgi:hypothetical protein